MQLSAKREMMIILFNKPFDCLSQFTDKTMADIPRRTLSDFINVKGVYPAGRLDRDSEGLLILTDNGRLQAKLSNPKFKTPKVYFAQVEGEIDGNAVRALQAGIDLKDGKTRPAKAEIAAPPDWLWPRNPPIRYRKSVPDSWLRLEITEGRNRQVRRMTADVGFPTLRLIRFSIGDWTIDGLETGQFKTLA